MTARYARAPGVCLELVGELWAAFSPASGETILMNDEGAAVLEVLGESARSTREVCEQLSLDVSLEHADIEGRIASTWPRLIEAGLVQERPPTS